MSEYKNEIQEENIDIRTLFRLFLKRKWWFVGTFIIVLILGIFYVISRPVFYEVRYIFSLEDDYMQDEFLQYSDSQEKYIYNKSVFIGIEDISLILETEPVVSGLEGIEGVDDYNVYVESSLVSLDLNEGNAKFTLKVKERSKELANAIALGLLESLNETIKESDKQIFDNTLEMVQKDMDMLGQETADFEQKIKGLDKNITGQNAEIFFYSQKIIENNYQVEKLNDIYRELSNEKKMVDDRIEILTEKPRYIEENNRFINSIIVILLSLLSGIIVVLLVNYFYKLKPKK